MTDRTAVQAATLVLAARRATRLLTMDTITQPARNAAFKRWPTGAIEYSNIAKPGFEPIPDASNPDAPTTIWWHVPPASKFGVWLAGMLGCPRWCASIWAAAAVAVCSRTRGLRWIPTVLALSETTAWLHETAEWGLRPKPAR